MGPNVFQIFAYYEGDDDFYPAMSDLEMLATNFIRRPYLEDLTRLPRMQELPVDAFAWQPKSQIFISHPWDGPNRPGDRILDAIRAFVPNREEVGLWIDYCCLPQKRRDGVDDRTQLEKQFFKSQLGYIPTILLKSQVVALWDERHVDRAWCVVELLLTDIFKNMVMKQVYHCREQLSDAIVLVTQTYDPVEYDLVGGVTGVPVVKTLLPHSIKNVPATFYSFLLNRLGLPPTLLTTLLGRVAPEHIDRYFDEYGLRCTNRYDLPVLKELLLQVCRFAGDYDVTTIRWSGKIPCASLTPYIMANLSDFTVNLAGYRFR